MSCLEPALGAGDGHPFAGAHADEVGVEVGDLAEHVEQESPAGGWGVDAAAESEGNPISMLRTTASAREGIQWLRREAIRLGQQQPAEGLETDTAGVDAADDAVDGSPLPDRGGIDARQ